MTTATITTPPACQPLEGGLRIPVALITPSPLNPRKRWKPEKVAQMSEDLKVNGQIQPIRVRPNPQHSATNGRPPYEIVVGETRWRAAPGAGIGLLDAIVADCTDHQLIQLALSENTKRQDLHPLEEADAYAELLRKPDGLQGYATVQELAAGIGVSPSYVYQRLKLRELCPAGREAFLSGQIEASVALLIARMPDQAEQARATARIVAGFGGEPFSARSASEYLRKEFMLRLDLARFDTTISYAVAGPCSACSKRSGAAPDLFPDLAGAGDLCQDARCYQAKAEEAHQALLAAAREAGRTVLQGAAARKVLPTPDSEPVGHYRLDAPCPALTDSQRPLRALLGQGSTAQIVVLDLPDRAPVELVPADVALAAIRARGLLRAKQPDKASPKPKGQATEPATPTTNRATGAQAAPAGTATPGPASASPQAAQRPADPHSSPRPAPPAADLSPRAGGGGEKEREAGGVDARPAGRGINADEASAIVARGVRFGVLLAHAMADHMQATSPGRDTWDRVALLALRRQVRELLMDLPLEATQLVWSSMEWPEPDALGWADTIDITVAEADGRELAEMLVLAQVVEDLTDAPRPGNLNRSTEDLLRACAVDVQAEWAQAGDEVRNTPDATDVFLAQHDAPSTRPETVVDPDWKFPSDHI